jgi:hypothetical protein
MALRKGKGMTITLIMSEIKKYRWSRLLPGKILNIGGRILIEIQME